MHPTDAPGADIRSQLRHAVVAVDLPCRGCAYDIKGLDGDGNCPECGLPVAATIQSVVDPHASRLPRLRNPGLVGNGLLWLMLCVVTAAGILGIVPSLELLGPRAGRLLQGTEHLPLLSAAAALLGLWSVAAFIPPRGREPDIAVWRDMWFLLAGLLLWALTCVGFWGRGQVLISRDVWTAWVDPWMVATRLVLVPAGILLLLGVGGVLSTIGRRSQAYRRSHAGRQGVNAMVMAMIGIAIGIMLRGAAGIWPARHWEIETDRGPMFVMSVVETVGAIVIGVCGVMAFIGLLYMLVNAAWVRSSLRKPPPHLAQLILPALPADTQVPRDEGEAEAEEGT